MKITKSYLKQLIKEELGRVLEADVLDLSKYRKEQPAEKPNEEEPPVDKPESTYVNPNEMHDARYKKALIQGMAELGKTLGELHKPYFDQDQKTREASTGIKSPSANDIIEASLPIIAKYHNIGKDPHGRELSVNFGSVLDAGGDTLQKCETAFGNAAGEYLNFLNSRGIRTVRVKGISSIFKFTLEQLKKHRQYILAQIAKRYPAQLTQFDKGMQNFWRSMDRQRRAADRRQRDI